jgi:hypothetical protein
MFARTLHRSGQPETLSSQGQGRVDNMLKNALVQQGDFLRSFPFSEAVLAQIRAVGLAIHSGQPIGADQFGEIVVLNPEATEQKENCDEQREDGAQRSPAGTREGRQGPQAAPSAYSRQAVRLPRRRDYWAELPQLSEGYPGSVRLRDRLGLWYMVPVFPLGKAGPCAKVITAIPEDKNARILSWGFWQHDRQIAWIGPRHTNYPDGSICAFVENEQVWWDGDPLLTYYDNLSEWGLRQLFLHFNGYWPGRQLAPGRYYRVREGLKLERCFCDKPQTDYFECCRPLDILQLCAEDKTDFLQFSGGVELGMQRPHRQLTEYVLSIRPKPVMSRIHGHFVDQYASARRN